MIRTLVVGFGQVAANFVVGLERLKSGELEPYGVPLAGYDFGVGVDEVEIVGAIDVDERKVGRDLASIVEGFYGFKNPPRALREVYIYRGLGGEWVKNIFPVRSEEWGESLARVEDLFSELRPDVVLDVTTTQSAPAFSSREELEKAVASGSAAPSQVYAYLALKASKRIGSLVYVNLNPTPVANAPAILELAEQCGCIVLGDDGATGATPLTADLLEHLRERNRRVYSIAQFNIGGNTDFLSLTDEKRSRAKEDTKSSIVKDILGYDAPHYIKPTGYLEPLGDKKFVAMHIWWESFNGAVDELVVIMRINDSPALAGLMVDLARIGWWLKSRGVKGTVYEVNAFYMKKPAPPGSRNVSRYRAYELLKEYLGVK
ncbi:inositol-3-phosphate synthase [Infirmifilum lucidum]|uniref:Inositol-3-phosphate synthase n=1 Tax=Infirmifilum lucidum TaxID=2776706 RepID=A0A7L9FJA2_9CREN|nr:inositol-3-phosphate synthase [Infirmifilum lucidum]